jgi:hypothetical protein
MSRRSLRSVKQESLAQQVVALLKAIETGDAPAKNTSNTTSAPATGLRGSVRC